MNPSTRIVVSCFSGDKQQIDQSLDLWLHHGCPVTFLSPEDAPVDIVHDGVDNRHAGVRGRSGPAAQARMLDYLKILLSYPEKFFLINESDSMCIAPDLPAYLYAEPDTFWSNNNESPQFMSRACIERMVAVASSAAAPTEWVDRYQLALAQAAGIPTKHFVNNVNGPISGCYDPATGQVLIPEGAERFGAVGTPVPPELAQAYSDHYQNALNSARAGASIIHSVKNGNASHALADQHKIYLEDKKAMNPDTRVIICCYGGDMHQLYMPGYLQHGCPVTIMSPENNKAIMEMPGVDCAFAGEQAYIGQASLDRQLAHMKLMLTYPENFFLCHDSDSIMLDAKIPQYLYENPGIVWSNQVDDGIPEHQPVFPPDWDHIALQPPYFLSRQVIEKMVAAGESGSELVKASTVMPFIDYYMVQLTYVAGLPYKRFADCVSCPITADPRKEPTLDQGTRDMYANQLKIVESAINSGAMILHSVKNPDVARQFLERRAAFLSGHPNPEPTFMPAPTVGPIRRQQRRGIPPQIQRQGRPRQRPPAFAGNPELKA